MTTGGRRALWLIVGVGALARVVLAFATVGLEFDIDSLRLVDAELDDRPLHVYDDVNPGGRAGDYEILRWPYPPGLFPWIEAASGIASVLGVAFHGVIQLLPIAADAAIAWLVQDFLGRRGHSQRTRLAAAALVAFGPIFFLVSGYHGQVDSVAILPAVAALWVWDTAPPRARRALCAGLLIGIGASIKTVPALMLLALLPSARSLREASTLVAAAAAVPAAMIAPFLLADPDGVTHALTYAGGPGLGGVSLLAQPGLGKAYVLDDPIASNALARALYDHQSLFVMAVAAAAGAFLLRFRPQPVAAAVILWLAIYALAPGFAMQYAIWGLPFFLMAGHLRAVALAQALMLAPALILYMRPWDNPRAGTLYVGSMLALWAVWAGWLAMAGRRAVR